MASRTSNEKHPNKHFLRLFLRWDILGFAASIALFLIFPGLDLIIASRYFSGEFFFFEENAFVRFSDLLFGNIHYLYACTFSLLALNFFYRDKHALKKKCIYLLLCLMLGPGLLVKVLLQDYSFGRPHPAELANFGGNLQYVPPFEFSSQCHSDCSFVSPHASLAFFILAIAWVRQRPVWIIYGIILGVTVGFSRMLQGKHFVSDIIFAFWATWFSCWLLAYKMKLTLNPPKSGNN